MADLEKKIEELAEKYARYNTCVYDPEAESEAKDFLNSPEFKELAEYIARESVKNIKEVISDNGKCIDLEFNQEWFNGLWRKDAKGN